MKENNAKSYLNTLIKNCYENRKKDNGGILIKSMVLSDLCDYIEYYIQEDFGDETIKRLAECGDDILTLLYDTFMGNKDLSCNSRNDIIRIIRTFLQNEKGRSD